MKTVNEIMELHDIAATELVHGHYHPLKEKRAALRTAIEELTAYARRYKFIRDGGAYIEPNQYDENEVKTKEMYMTTDSGGKYYTDMRDFDMDLDAAIEGMK